MAWNPISHSFEAARHRRDARSSCDQLAFRLCRRLLLAGGLLRLVRVAYAQRFMSDNSEDAAAGALRHFGVIDALLPLRSAGKNLSISSEKVRKTRTSSRSIAQLASFQPLASPFSCFTFVSNSEAVLRVVSPRPLPSTSRFSLFSLFCHCHSRFFPSFLSPFSLHRRYASNQRYNVFLHSCSVHWLRGPRRGESSQASRDQNRPIGRLLTQTSASSSSFCDFRSTARSLTSSRGAVSCISFTDGLVWVRRRLVISPGGGEGRSRLLAPSRTADLPVFQHPLSA